MTDIDALKRDKRPQSAWVVHALIDRLEAAESEALEEARLNGMGSEREAALMAKLEAAEKSDAESLAMYRKARDERDALRAEIEELHVLIAAVKKRADAEFRLRVKKEEEYTRLRAKIAEMEKQEPVAEWLPLDSGEDTRRD